MKAIRSANPISPPSCPRTDPAGSSSPSKPSATEADRVPFRALAPFLLVSFGLAWGILGLFIFLPDPTTRIFGPLTGQHPLFYLCVYAPAIAAFALVAHHGGSAGLRRFLSRFLLWRCPRSWFAFLTIGIPLIFMAGAALRGNPFAEPFPFSSAGSLLAALGFAAIKGPVEEFGWRGLALPLLQRRFAPFWSGLMLGLVWGFWHLPAFLLSGTQQSEWAFAPFFVGCVALSVIVTALFHVSGGSILLSAFFHFMLMNPIFPDAQPYDTYLFSMVAVFVAWRHRGTMFARNGAIVDVIPRPAARPSPSSVSRRSGGRVVPGDPERG